ncbi:hypothetical protein [Liquorilactobacillus satsumensis]|uniref:Uncharacterized protein n=1 Tax=Liquorilactobacillus satsumensis DSM 16230 = JCM 12392 TaxID=1423801 RepID=A0A0R1V4A5_9LACO|nr:hypothetical protein [Liquorilactobacillus satsumensis]KRL98104.1 hypothetical protein FD50_GL000926 [Liquorilactobacillus satsumensis DSM 16230 = JCM 12392]MCC7667358.1 hypothetical protein [Liquorilactobacillus satsumensis]MCP9313217.1 hypothetical protein [Liquorilactobacillus satsumensis]MCP9329469.1 hypothetical protein [Liquorilactobacillus satsumensis]MCP9358202.1 hypothetical protein [Liquorilactobacillus satsumensis]
MKIREKDDWLINQLDLLATQSKRYETRAFFMCMSECAAEQKKRLEQAKGELDGRLWSPKNW